MKPTFDLLNVRGGVIALKSPYILNEINGVGMPPVKHLTQNNAQQDGATYLDTRLQPRTVTLGFDALESCAASLWDRRQAIIALMSELQAGFILRARVPNDMRLHLPLRYDSGLTLPYNAHMAGNYQRFALQAIAHNPIWYDPNIVTIVYSLGDMAGEGFPLSFPISLGTGEFLGLSPVVYPGTWDTYPIITITGPAEDIVIDNNTTGETLDMTGWTLDPGESIVIDLTPGMKTITHSVDGNVPYWLSTDSDLGTWHIARAPDAPGGINDVQVSFSGGQAATTIRIDYYVKYIGI